MTKVDFYTGSPDKLRTVCQLSQKAIQNGVRAIISLPDATTVDALDRMLWHYPPSAFIPHCRNNAAAAEPGDSSGWPVVLDHGGDRFPHHELLINLHNECMPFFSRFERVIEIIGNSEDDSRAGRERFRFYRDRGYELRHIDLSGTHNT
ncbi:MAG: DNA polymerase III subunit chi [Gallionella sp.]|nr:DNA polymerase III subunit chi [Gallionella sp.]